MENLNIQLQTPQVREVFRQFHVTGNGMEAVRQGFDRSGVLFMNKLIKAMSPNTVLSGNFGNTAETGPFSATQQTYEAATGKGWDFWVRLLEMTGKTGETIGKLKDDILSPGTATPEEAAIATAQAQQKHRTNTIIYVAAAAILIVVAYFLFKK